MPAHVEIYTKPTCGYCHAAKRLLAGRGVSYLETDITGNPGKRQEMLARAPGRFTVPQIFIDGVSVGGYEDIRTLDRAGRLDRLLQAAA